MTSEEDGQESNNFLGKLDTDNIAIQINNPVININVNFMFAKRGTTIMIQIECGWYVVETGQWTSMGRYLLLEMNPFRAKFL